MQSPPPVRVGLFGGQWHQIHRHLMDNPRAKLVALADFPDSKLPEALRDDPDVRRYDSLQDLLEDERVDLVSLCSPRRADQAGHAMACLEAGRHVYAEKPAAVTEADLDHIVATADRTGRVFREMAGTAFDQPFLAVRESVARGEIGEVVQVLAQKSYPLRTGRPQDEAVDGGLLMQAGVHALRMIEHVARVRVRDVTAIESQKGNTNADPPGNLRIACSMQMHLENGGLATVICNYLNPKAFPRHGNETLRIFGTEGFVEVTDGGAHTRLVTHDRDHGPLDTSQPTIAYHDLLFDAVRGLGEMPVTSEEELHPTRIVLRAKEALGGVL